MAARDEDLALERVHVAGAYACLDAMRARAERALAQATHDRHLDTAFDAAAIHHELKQRVAALAASKAALTFGRIDNDDGAVYYVGRRHVENEHGDPVVVDWRAAVSAPFYRATWADPLGLELRRRFAIEGTTLAGLFDERFSDPDAHAEGGGVPDPLLAELDRARTGEMRDIVATIQAEQDVIIRAPLNELLVVQGGPGTGKTAVGLHRAAFLLFEHRAELARKQLLVVGPNPLFLTYIAQVLPSLGETAVVQTTLVSLLARYVVRGEDADDARALKGDARMAHVIRRAVRGRIAGPSGDGDPEVMTAFGMARWTAEEVRDRIAAVSERSLPTNDAREVLRSQLLALAWRTYEQRPNADPNHHVPFENDLRTGRQFKALLDKWWPQMTGPAILRQLFANKRALAVAADGILTASEQAMLHRRNAPKVGEERWTRADLSLLDEADSMVSGVNRTFGHVVVDEAQDLSAMELRVVARRSPERSLTILGDLAQSTAVGGQERWDTALAQMEDGSRATGRVVELELGYRVPAPILEFANRLLPMAAPSVRPSRSVRLHGEPPRVIGVADAVELPAAAVGQIAALAAEYTSIGVIAVPALLDAIAEALVGVGVTFSDTRRSANLDATVSLLTPSAAKGLEFDAVVVVEPSRIFEEEHRGPRVLYVALTRAVQQLCIVHAAALPSPLYDPLPAPQVV